MAEHSLHLALKQWIARTGDRVEVEMGDYIIDIVRDELLIEIQTRNFTAIRKKLNILLPQYKIHLIHPIAKTKWIAKFDALTGERVSRRRSPKRGDITDLFKELVYIPTLIDNPNLTLEVLFTEEEEIHINDGQGSWRRKGWSIKDRFLLDVVDQMQFTTSQDFLSVLPPDLPEQFTTKEIAKRLKKRPRVAQKITYCLKHMNLIKTVGKSGNAHLYQVV